MPPLATVLPTRYLPSPEAESWTRSDVAVAMALPEALTKPWPTDAHLVAYEPVTIDGVGPLRLTYRALSEGVSVRMALLLGDLDGPDHKATDEWRTETLAKIEASGLAYYETRGGYRVLATLAEPITLSEPSDADDWTRLYQGWIVQLKAEHGLEIDPACADWTRLYRLPCVRREGVGNVSAPVVGELPAVDWRSIKPSEAKATPRNVDRPEPEGGDPELVEPLIEALAEAIEPTWNDHSHNGFRFPFLGWLAGKGWSRDERAALIETLDDGTHTAKYLGDNDRAGPAAGPGPLVLERFGEDFAAVDKIVARHPNARTVDAYSAARASEVKPVTAPSSLVERLQKRTDEKPHALATGMPAFDRQFVFGGIPTNRRVVIGGAPDAGKTSLMLQWAEHMASLGVAVAWNAVDEDSEDLDTRRVQSIGIPRVQAQAKLSDEALKKVERELGGRIFEVFENVPIDEVIKWMAVQYPGKDRAVFGDSLQTICSTGSLAATNPRERIDAVIQDIKTTQLTHRTLVVLTSELNRNAYRNKDQADNIDPMAAGKESGGIEYAAGMFIVLRSEGEGVTSVEIPKCKFGSKKTFKLKLNFETVRFSETTGDVVTSKDQALVELFVRCLTRERDRGGPALTQTGLRDAAHADPEGPKFTNGCEGTIINMAINQQLIERSPTDSRKFQVPASTLPLDPVAEAERRAKQAGVLEALAKVGKKDPRKK